MVESVRVELEELDLLEQPELVEQAVDLAPRRAAKDVVHLGAEAVGAEGEGVCVAAGRVVGLEDDHPPPRLREQRGRAEAGHAGADHEIVAGLNGVGHRAQGSRSASAAARSVDAATQRPIAV